MEPWLGFRLENMEDSAVRETKLRGMQGVVRQDQAVPLFLGQSTMDEVQVEVFIQAVEFVADNRVTVVREVDSDLVFSACLGHGLDQASTASL